MGDKKGTMTISLMNMYENLLADEFKPVITILEARSKMIEPMIKVQVKKDLGVYDLLLRKAALEEELRDIEEQLRQKAGIGGSSYYRGDNDVDKETKRRIEEENIHLAKVKAYQASIVKSIKLSSGTPEMQQLFKKLEPEIEGFLKEAKQLPPIKWKPTKTDMKLLSLEGVRVGSFEEE